MNAPLTSPKTRVSIKRVALDSLVVPDRDPASGIIPIDKLTSDLLVQVPNGPDFLESLSVQMFINNDFEDPANFIGDPLDLKGLKPGDPSVRFFDLYYKVSEFPAEGEDVTVDLNYFLFDTDSESYVAGGLPVQVRFDRKPAGGDELPPIAFTDAQLSGITDSDLDSNGKLNVLIDPYFLGESDDVIELWLGDSPTTGNYLTPSYTVADPKLQIPVSFTRAQLDAAGDAITMYFAYRVTDFAGNVSRISNVVGIPVFINLPTLDPPVVPEAADGLVTFNDANPSVTVEIPHYNGAALGDEVVVTWAGTRVLPGYVIRQEDIDRDPALPIASIEVPFATVVAGGNGLDIKVSYELRRVNNPDVPSPEIDVPVNLTTPGGPDPDPDPELPEHGNIRAPLIQCGTSPDNSIAPGDFHLPATATAFRQGEDNAPIWLVGDVIQFHWGTVSAPNIGSVTVAVGNEGANIPVTIPFGGVIEDVGVGPVVVYFTLTRQLPVAGGGTVPVTVQSKEQIVQVASTGALPGDGAQLRAGLFPEANSRNIITKAVGSRGTYFRILLDNVTNIELSTNPKVSYDFVGVATGDASGPPTPPGAPIEASRIKEDDVSLTQTHLDQGYIDVPLPYAKTYFICRNGAKLNYSLVNDTGRNSDHIEQFVRFAMNEAGGTCLVPTFASASNGASGISSVKGIASVKGYAGTSVPSNLPPIAFTEDQRSGITDEDLEDGLLIAQVNPYFDSNEGDVIEPWVGLSEAEGSGRYLTPTSTVEEPGKKTPISFSQADLLERGNGQRLYFGYRVIDGTGAVSDLSRLVGIPVNLAES